MTSVLPDTHFEAHRSTTAIVAGLEVETGGAGLVLGLNRQHVPVTARLFRPEPTRAVMVGGLRCAQLLAFRAIALGVRVVVQSARPAAWEGFARAVEGSVGFVAPGLRIGTQATATRPLLVILDVGPTVGEMDQASIGWQATVTVRDELTAWDVDTLVRADLVVLQPLTEVEAALAASALGLSEVQEWLSRIRADMVTLISRGTLRWALLSPTAIERQLIGTPTRF